MYSPPDPAAFSTQVYEIVRLIPSGRVISYGQIAAMLPLPRGVDPLEYSKLSPRWVGAAMADCPDDLPWQRVVNGGGGISVRKNSTGHLQQRAKLGAEGVTFDERGRVDWDRFEWQGPPDEWLRARGYFSSPRKSSSPAEQFSLL